MWVSHNVQKSQQTHITTVLNKKHNLEKYINSEDLILDSDTTNVWVKHIYTLIEKRNFL